MLVGLLGAVGASAQERSSPLVLEDRTRVTRAILVDSFEEHGFEFGEPSTIQATGEPQLIGQKDTTVVTFVGVPTAITQVAVIGIASADNPAINATIMLGMAVALKQLAPCGLPTGGQAPLRASSTRLSRLRTRPPLSTQPTRWSAWN